MAVLITTERLVLRRFRAADAATLLAYRTDPAVARYQSWPVPSSPAEADRFVAAMAADDPDEPGWFQYALERVEDHAHIGDVAVNLHSNRRRADLGVTLARAYQGKGYAAEAVRGLLDHLFRVRGLHKVSAEADARNTASARLLERLGFTREGRLRQQTFIKNEWTDDLIYGLLAPEWLGR